MARLPSPYYFGNNWAQYDQFLTGWVLATLLEAAVIAFIVAFVFRKLAREDKIPHPPPYPNS